MMELYQAEWCPHSRRVRERMTELSVDFVARQVPADKSQRVDLLERCGADSIPVLVTHEGTAIVGEQTILNFLESNIKETAQAAEHRAKAEMVRQRERKELHA